MDPLYRVRWLPLLGGGQDYLVRDINEHGILGT